MTLNKDSQFQAYQLGRLFALLERIQLESRDDSEKSKRKENEEQATNKTEKSSSSIRGSYYGSASSRPATAFPGLIKLSRHHLDKLSKNKPGLYVVREKDLEEIFSHLRDEEPFNKTLSLENQGRFAVGYYHQRQDFFKEKSDPSTS